MNDCKKKEVTEEITLITIADLEANNGNDEASNKFLEDVKNEFEMSMIGEINFFLGLQIVQNKQGIFISQTKYLKDLLKIFGLET